MCLVLKAHEPTKNQHNKTTPQIHSMVSNNLGVSAQIQNVWQSLLLRDMSEK